MGMLETLLFQDVQDITSLRGGKGQDASVQVVGLLGIVAPYLFEQDFISSLYIYSSAYVDTVISQHLL